MLNAISQESLASNRSCSLLGFYAVYLPLSTFHIIIAFCVYIEGQGINIMVSMWDEDNSSSTDDIIDQFSFDYTDQPGSKFKTIYLESTRGDPKSW